MKLIFDSLDAFLAEAKDRKVDAIRVARALHMEPARPTAGIPSLTSRVIVTAPLDDRCWAEFRLWVGRAPAEVGEHGLRLPESLKKKSDAALAEIARRVDDAGFEIREGLFADEGAWVDSFRG